MKRINKNILYIAYFVTIIIIGSIGFYIIGGNDWSWLDSIYMTIITLFFVGFSEVHPLTDLGRIWAIVVIVFGVAGIGMLFASMRDIIIYFNTYRRIIMMNKIKNLKNHFIICGYGRMGAVIANELSEQNQTFIIIEQNDEKVEYIRESGMYCIHGDATLDDTLKSASVVDAKGIAVALNTDQDNLFVTMTIRTLNSKAFLLSRCANDQNKSKLLRSGANKVINPYITGGHRMAEMLLRPEIIDSVSVTTPGDQNLDLNIDEISVSKTPSFIGKTIKQTNIRDNYDLMIVCIIKNDNSNIINPQSDHIIDKNDTIMVIGDKEKLDKFASEQTS
tara:strand:- start:5548 stop:6546 length:999 start_codon:yes stop_codon:yes gene_type:complete